MINKTIQEVWNMHNELIELMAKRNNELADMITADNQTAIDLINDELGELGELLRELRTRLRRLVHIREGRNTSRPEKRRGIQRRAR